MSDARTIRAKIVDDLKNGRSVTVRGINLKYRTNGATARLSEIGAIYPLSKRWAVNERTKKPYKIYSLEDVK